MKKSEDSTGSKPVKKAGKNGRPILALQEVRDRKKQRADDAKQTISKLGELL